MLKDKKTLWLLLSTFTKISIVGVGGGLAMLPIIEQYFVKKHKLISNEDLIDYIAITQSMPGIIATNMSCFVGMRIAGFPGAVASTIGMIIPPFVIISAIVIILGQIGPMAVLDQIFMGVRAGVAALILISAFKMGRKIFVGRYAQVITIIAFLILSFTDIDVILVIVVGTVLGIIFTLCNLLDLNKNKEVE